MANPRDFFDSPLFSTAKNSPMTDLALNLKDTNIGVAARRKLSLSSNSSTPHSIGSPMMISPLSPDRLLKSSLKFSSGVTPTGIRKPFARRLAHQGDENFNPMQNSPIKSSLSPSKFQAVRGLQGAKRQPLEDYDPNSQDSGYGLSEDSKSTSSADFNFAQPSGFAPRKSTAESPRSFSNSTSSTDSFDDGFSDFTSLQDEEAQLPPGLGSLIMDPILNHGVPTESPQYVSFHQAIQENIPMSPIVEEKNRKRCLSTPQEVTPVSKRYKAASAGVLQESNTPQRKQHTLFDYGFKLVGEPRPLLSHSMSLEEPLTPPPRPKFRHCLSESEAVNINIKEALHRCHKEEVIGDFSLPFALPVVSGNHQDLKSITSSTLAKLINGEFKDVIASYRLVDCRYPYEFEGGHIKGAVNLYTKDQLLKEFLENKTAKSSPDQSQPAENHKRDIIVFHCEFSSERGPNLSRFLRKQDREMNTYPALHHPELYLLHGGYKAFFYSHGELCEPCTYRMMVDEDFKGQLQHFRAKSKTWSGDKSARTLKRSTSFKRLGL